MRKNSIAIKDHKDQPMEIATLEQIKKASESAYPKESKCGDRTYKIELATISVDCQKVLQLTFHLAITKGSEKPIKAESKFVFDGMGGDVKFTHLHRLKAKKFEVITSDDDLENLDKTSLFSNSEMALCFMEIEMRSALDFSVDSSDVFGGSI